MVFGAYWSKSFGFGGYQNLIAKIQYKTKKKEQKIVRAPLMV